MDVRTVWKDDLEWDEMDTLEYRNFDRVLPRQNCNRADHPASEGCA